MAFKEVLDLNADTTKKLEKVGEKESGYYLGFRTNETAFGVSRLHIFKTATGNVGIWGSAQLDEKLSRVEPGTMTQVKFEGKETLKGGRTLKKFKVLSDNENTIDVAVVVAESSAADADASDSSESISDDTAADYADEASAEDEISDVAPRSALAKGKAQSFGKEHQKQLNTLLSKK